MSREPRIAIVGAGMAGYGAAYCLAQQGLPAVIYEQNSFPGGHTATHDLGNGFRFDDGPHVSFTKDERIQNLFAESVEGQYEVIQVAVNNYFRGHWVKHPAQCNLHGLPEELVVEVLRDFIQARQQEPSQIRNYEDWLRATYGDKFAETFPMQYGKKYHTTDAANMSTDWLGPRLYVPDLDEVLKGALSPQTPEVHYVTHFRYPTHGGFVSYLNGFLPNAELKLNHQVAEIVPATKTLRFANGPEVEYDGLVSSIPLPKLIPLISEAPSEVLQSAAQLAWTTCVTVNIGINRSDISECHWTYFYDDDYFFTRLSFPHMQSPNNVPANAGSIQAEVYYSSKYRPLDRRPEACIEPVLKDLRRCGLLREDDEVLCAEARVVPFGNVIFDLDRAAALEIVHGYLDEIEIAYCGRYGEWGYQWTDESFKSGEAAAQRSLERLGDAAAG